jgi:hypothetical protein
VSVLRGLGFVMNGPCGPATPMGLPFLTLPPPPAASRSVIRSMRHRASFLRNPRYRDAEPRSGTWRRRRSSGGDAAAATDSSRAAALPLPEAVAVEGPAGAGQAQTAAVPWLRAQPSKVVFGGYKAGQALTATLQLRNVGAIMRGLRLLPPASQYFHASMLRCAPGRNGLEPGPIPGYTDCSRADLPDACHGLSPSTCHPGPGSPRTQPTRSRPAWRPR